ncbi:MAG: hypothetical protein GC160_14900 [Acidobacteria bacterium]|nr:hypothetical protein [Acidobacteriota bacterium]
MPSSPKRRLTALGVGALGGALALSGALPDRARFVRLGDWLESALFEQVETPGGPVSARRPTPQTRAALTERIASQPDEAQLYALRALEDERALDFTAAERDWREHAARAADPAAGQLALADFFARRNRAADEAAALLEVGRAPAPPEERFVEPSQQRSWQAFERIQETIDAHLLGDELRAEAYRAWLGRYPAEQEVYRRYLSFLIQAERLPAAEDLLADYAAQFPDDPGFVLAGRARAAVAAGGDAAGLTLYEQAFQPDWPESLLGEYFGLLQKAERLRARLDEARAALAADPDSLAQAAWIYHYRRRAGDPAAALQALSDYSASKQARSAAWTARELAVVAELYRRAEAHEDAARCYYALYSLPGSDATARETALAGLIDELLTAAEAPIALGARNLSIYQDIARADTGPGALNGILSLLLNDQGLDWRFDNLDRLGQSYFRRSAAVKLLARLDAEFPGSTRRAALRARAIEALALYGDDEAILSEGRRFLDAFATAPERVDVSLRMAEAYARQERVEDELAVYERLLGELAARADGAPLGPGAVEPLSYSPGPRPPLRSPEYARTLDRAVSRLTSLGRLSDALALYAREIARNPDDPGLYERLAGFLAANGLAARVEAVYKQAMEQFQDRSWEHKLGRFYLRAQKRAELEALTRQAADSFSGQELEEYFQTVNPGALDAQLFLQLNRYAHERFPHNLSFVRNLLSAYRNPATRDEAAWAELLRRSWFWADDLRSQFFGHLVRTGRLEQELAALQASSDAARAGRWSAVARQNPAAAQIVAEGRAWRCRFEEAGPVFTALATESPVDEPFAGRAIDLERSLAAYDPIATDLGVALSEAQVNFRPADREQLAFTGDILADRKLYDRAKPYWDRMAATEPGKPESWLDAATVFWDYYLFDDALRLLDQGRKRLDDPALFSYEAGAIAEGRKDRNGAVAEYLKGALSGAPASRTRLATLSRRAGYAEPIEQASARLTASANPSLEAVRLRLAVLDAQKKSAEVETLLQRLAADAGSYSLLDEIELEASNRSLPQVQAAALERRIELTRDPVDKLRRRLQLVRLQESLHNPAAAEAVSAAVYADSPRILGVVRARTDFLWRHDRKPQAIATLVEAAGQAYPALAAKLRFEAAEKSIEAERHEQARELLSGLLDDAPFDARYLSALADSYAREGRNEALRDLYQQKIQALDAAPLSAEDKRSALALLRRGLIPALERLGDHAGAVDQYIELVNRFPDDAGLVEEAGLYALRHGQRERLEQAYMKTTEASPRDVRYHRVLARLRLLFENLPGALEAYEKALAVRPESVELQTARAGLLERLLRFEDAREVYRKLYELSYQDPRWIEKVGEIDARLGEDAAAVEAVRRARIEGRPARPENFFGAAETLEGWGLVEPALDLAEEGLQLAGGRLYGDFSSGARLYARLSTRLRRQDIGWVRLRAAFPPDRDDYFFYQWQEPVRAILQTAEERFTPEEKVELGGLLDRWKAQASPAELDAALLPALASSQFAGVEVRWRRERLLAQPAGPQSQEDRRRLIELETRRLRHLELGRLLELVWQAHPARNQERQILDEAAAAYRAGGDVAAELRVLELQQGQGRWAERYLELLLQRAPQRLAELAASSQEDVARRAADYAVLRGAAELARRAVEAYGRRRPPVWTPAYTGLVGLFHAAPAPAFGQAFVKALGDAPIGERLGQPVDRAQQLAGDRWFEYGADYGEYLGAIGSAGAEDYLYAGVEAAPGRAEAYAAVAEAYREGGNLPAAEREYQHALELAPRDPTTHLRLAEIAWESNRRDDAIGFWRTALARYAEQAERYRFDPGFWQEVPALLGRVADPALAGALREPADELITTFVRRGGAYRLGEFLRPWLSRAADPQAAWNKLLALAPQAGNPVELLTALADLEWVEPERRRAAADAALRGAEAELNQASPNMRWLRLEAVQRALTTLVLLDLDAGRAADAWARIQASDEEVRAGFTQAQAAFVLEAGALSGHTPEALAAVFPPEDSPNYYGPAYGSDPLAEAVAQLRAEEEPEAADALLELRYQRQIERRDLGPAPLLGLAELRLQQGRADEAAALIDRLLLNADDPFAQHLAAGELLLRYGAYARAATLLDARVRAAPWEGEARLRLAQAQAGAGRRDEAVAGLQALARSPTIAYGVRAEGALALRELGAPAAWLDSAELDRLATGAGPADGPYYYPARLDAARQAAGAEKAGLLASALAARPMQESPELRLEYFQAAADAGEPEQALSALRPLFDQAGLGYALDQVDSVFAEETYERSADPWVAERFLYGQGLTTERRAEVAGRAADLLQGLGRLEGAEMLYDLALQLDGSPEVGAKLEAVRGERQARARRAARRPVIQDGLEQPHPVHPREGGSR